LILGRGVGTGVGSTTTGRLDGSEIKAGVGAGAWII